MFLFLEIVFVRLNFSIEVFNIFFQGDMCLGGESIVWFVFNQDMDIELVKIFVIRDVVVVIDKENVVYNYIVLQFVGIMEIVILFGKVIYFCKDGVIIIVDVEFQVIIIGFGGIVVKYWFVVIVNVDGIDFNILQENIFIYLDLQNMYIL